MIRTPSVFVCADWAKGAGGRAVWLCEVQDRRASPLRASSGWSFAAVLEALVAYADRGPVLAAFDVPLGVPARFLESWSEAVRPVATFPQLLMQVRTQPSFFDPCVVPVEWRPTRPFFRVAPGPGGKQQFVDAAADAGTELLRSFDRTTQAKPMFAVSGIPGSVGSATAALWRELIDARDRGRDFALWPFEPERDRIVTIAEIYPRVAYAETLGYRPKKKGDRFERTRAISSVVEARWFEEGGLSIERHDLAAATEDDFDACVTAVALLRRIVEGRPLVGVVDPIAEGAMLLH